MPFWIFDAGNKSGKEEWKRVKFKPCHTTSLSPITLLNSPKGRYPECARAVTVGQKMIGPSEKFNHYIFVFETSSWWTTSTRPQRNVAWKWRSNPKHQGAARIWKIVYFWLLSNPNKWNTTKVRCTLLYKLLTLLTLFTLFTLFILFKLLYTA